MSSTLYIKVQKNSVYPAAGFIGGVIRAQPEASGKAHVAKEPLPPAYPPYRLHPLVRDRSPGHGALRLPIPNERHPVDCFLLAFTQKIGMI